ncbi:hypothetical protein V6L77_00010 [Pannonibacter sp. Pt2-lr]
MSAGLAGACSELQAVISHRLTSWPAICEAAEEIRVLIGVSPSAYAQAVEQQAATWRRPPALRWWRR